MPYERVAVNTESLAELLDCGRSTAIKIGELASARVQIGKRILWNMNKIQSYIDSISTDNSGGDENGL
ncbi:MAG: hypothetical protein K6G88_03255 [Lachnospiraceae bacterium]|nr:hypothetical protein [Lachnospiraceae bacterium]